MRKIEYDWQDAFAPHILTRGKKYYEEGRVSQIIQYGNRITAHVDGTDDYCVEIDLPGGVPDNWLCTCPYADQGDCKHKAAVLFAVEAGEYTFTGNPPEFEEDIPVNHLSLPWYDAVEKLPADIEITYIYLSNVEKATIKSNIKTGFGLIASDAKRGIVSAHDRSKEYTYRFVCNTDHSVTVTDVFDPEADKQLIDEIWRDFHNVRFSKESNGRAGSRRRNSDFHSDGLQKAQPMERTAEMAVGTSEGNRQRDSRSGGENRSNSGADTSRDTSEIKFSREATEEQLQEDKNNGRRKESAEDFDRRTSEELLTKGQKGRLAYAYRPYLGTPSQSAQAAREGLKKIGVPVIIFERLEGNKGNETTMYPKNKYPVTTQQGSRG